jgi:hypothetical protein
LQSQPIVTSGPRPHRDGRKWPLCAAKRTLVPAKARFSDHRCTQMNADK